MAAEMRNCYDCKTPIATWLYEYRMTKAGNKLAPVHVTKSECPKQNGSAYVGDENVAVSENDGEES